MALNLYDFLLVVEEMIPDFSCGDYGITIKGEKNLLKDGTEDTIYIQVENYMNVDKEGDKPEYHTLKVELISNDKERYEQE